MNGRFAVKPCCGIQFISWSKTQLLDPKLESFLGSVKHLPKGEKDGFLAGLSSPPTLSIRRHPLRKIGPFETRDRVPWCDDAIYLEQRPSFSLDPYFHAGAYYVQEASSMILQTIWPKLKVGDNPMVLDLCASPGGKSTHLLSLLEGRGMLVSNEAISKRVNTLIQNLDKWGYANRIVTSSDPKYFAKLDEVFDVAMVDAPCSGEGMFRKNPVALESWSKELVEHCALRQRRILKNIWPSIKPGGYLIYSTCTFNRSENENELKSLLKQGESLKFDFPEKWHIQATDFEGVHAYRFNPHMVRGEGFCVSVIRKNGRLELEPRSKEKSQRKDFPDVFNEPANHNFALQGDFINLFGESMKVWNRRLKGVRVVQFGQPAFSTLGKSIQFAHGLSHSVNLDKGKVANTNVDHKTALEYLRGNALPNPHNLRGMVLISFEGQALGWGKAIQGRINNLYPKYLRIRNG